MNRQGKSNTSTGVAFCCSLFALTLFLFPCTLRAQQLQGIVMDVEEGLPVRDVTVYLNGTTTGTISDTAGHFALFIRDFPAELVFSHVSYGFQTLVIDSLPGTTLSVQLRPRPLQLEQVSVSEENQRKKNLRKFNRMFLGNDRWGRRARIVNEDDLSFLTDYGFTGKKRKKELVLSFRVFASAPLQIALPDLGYELRYDLVSFSSTRDTLSGRELLSTSGYCYFTSTAGSDPQKDKQLRRNRLAAYYNSPQHFTRSLFSSDLEENGYRVYLISDSLVDGHPYISHFKPDKCGCMIVGTDVALLTGLKNQQLYVNYFGGYNGPINLNRAFYKLPYAKKSLVYILHDPCPVRRNGTRPANSLSFSGSLGDKRIGATLPDDFDPDNVL
ncbi:MAG: carboxypeptidase-like regulatory domain-containing protein [Bacteroidota bacterium]